MERSGDREAAHEPCVQAKDASASLKRQTRGTAKLSKMKQGTDMEKRGRESGSVRQKKTVPKESTHVPKKRKGKQVPPAVVDAIFGNIKSCVADVEELWQKRDEDALKCGRITRIIDIEGRTSKDTNENPKSLVDGALQKGKGHDSSECTYDFSNCNDSMRPKTISAELPGTKIATRTQYTSRPSTHLDRFVGSDFLNEEHQLNLESRRPTSKVYGSSQKIDVVEFPIQKEKYVGSTSQDVQQTARLGENKRTATVGLEYDDRDHGREERGRKVMVPDGNGGQRRWLYPSWSADCEGDQPRSVDEKEMWRRRHTRSLSPEYGRRSVDRSGRGEFYEHFSGTQRSNAMESGNSGAIGKSYEVDKGRFRLRRRPSPYISRQYEQERSLSPPQRSTLERDIPDSLKSRTPIMSLVCQPRDGGESNERRESHWTANHMLKSDPSLERRVRRRTQSVRESQKLQRAGEGKKPFYLTLDIEGRPHGPGRPAWIADINKLAVALDPSCIDIRKQAHGDICNFKNRLDDNFEYSGDLNEDYLRGLMGKAVTRRRADLINFIKNGGERREHFNKDVWKRLEKLSSSKQREMRSEHGRYANACRRTVGRTSALGEEGVKQRLREAFGRSPELEEVVEEMQRDKGFGRGRPKTSEARMHSQQGRSEDIVRRRDRDIQSHGIQLRHISDDENDVGKQSHGEPSNEVFKKKEAMLGKEVEETEWLARTDNGMNGSASRYGATNLSKEKYISELEVELKRMREDNRRKFPSPRWRPRDFGRSPANGVDEILYGNPLKSLSTSTRAEGKVPEGVRERHMSDDE